MKKPRAYSGILTILLSRQMRN